VHFVHGVKGRIGLEGREVAHGSKHERVNGPGVVEEGAYYCLEETGVGGGGEGGGIYRGDLRGGGAEDGGSIDHGGVI